MNLDDVRAITAEAVPTLKRALNLYDWTINFNFGSPDEPGANGQCSIDAAYRTATIRLDPNEIEDRKEVCHVLRHEMLHIVIAEADLGWKAARAALQPISPPTVSAVDEAHEHGVERAIGALERMFDLGFELTAEEICGGGKARRKKGWIGIR